MYLRLHITGRFGQRGSANWPQMDQFKKNLDNFPQKSKLKGGLFYKKLSTQVCHAPYCGPLAKLGVCQSAENKPILKFFYTVLFKTQI